MPIKKAQNKLFCAFLIGITLKKSSSYNFIIIISFKDK